MLPRCTMLALLGILASQGLAAGQGRLQQVREEIREEKKDEKDEGKDGKGDNTADVDSGWGWFSWDCGTSSDPDGVREVKRRRPWFLAYPYQAGYPGFMAPRRWDTQEDFDRWGDKLDVKRWQVRASVEEGYDFDGIHRIGANLLVEHVNRWGVLTQWHNFYERLSCGCWDQLTIGDLNLTYRLLNEEAFTLRAGAGLKTAFDRYQGDVGGNFYFGLDLFPAPNWVAQTSLDVGWIRNSDIVHLHGQLGYTWKHLEIFGGYDFQRIGSVNLQGPLLGARVWF